jgi:hypothetical protein
MTLPQRNTVLAKPTNFYYLMCKLDRAQYQYNGKGVLFIDGYARRPRGEFLLNKPDIVQIKMDHPDSQSRSTMAIKALQIRIDANRSVVR